MSTQINIIKTFKGHFSYLYFDEHGEAIEGDHVKFEMQLEFDGDNFHGSRVDEESEGLFDKPITVNGFIEGHLISFIVKYPYGYYFDEEKQCLVADKKSEYPGCEYEGYYNEELDCYIGRWIIIEDAQNEGTYQTDQILEVSEGCFEMKEVKQ